MAAAEKKKRHPIVVLHVIAMVALAFWWAAYFWAHSPARELLQRQGVHERKNRPHQAAPATEDAIVRQFHRVLVAVEVGLADLAAGLVTLIGFAVGTGIYVRQAEIWLQARSSGEAMALGGSELGDAALAANRADLASGFDNKSPRGAAK